MDDNGQKFGGPRNQSDVEGHAGEEAGLMQR